MSRGNVDPMLTFGEAFDLFHPRCLDAGTRAYVEDMMATTVHARPSRCSTDPPTSSPLWQLIGQLIARRQTQARHDELCRMLPSHAWLPTTIVLFDRRPYEDGTTGAFDASRFIAYLADQGFRFRDLQQVLALTLDAHLYDLI